METSEMSATINNHGQNFLDEWTTNSTRAGVILNPHFCFSDVYTSPQECRSRNDSFTTEFAPLQFSNNSSCFSLDSLQNESLLEKDIINENKQHGFEINDSISSDLCPNITQHTNSSQNGLLSCSNVAEKQASERTVYNSILEQRLEQLKEWQQERQEQLKKQHLEQLQRLVNEQQTRLSLVGTQEYTGQTEVIHEKSSASTTSSELLNVHQSNKDSTDPTPVESMSEKSYSNGPPSFAKLEERPIKPGISGGKETFEEFLDKQMRMEEQRLQQQQLELKQSLLHPIFSEDDGNKKRKFLRCGEGLARFSKIKSNNQATLKANKGRNLTNQDSVSSKKITTQQMQRKMTQLNKRSYNISSTRLVNKPKAIGKGKNNTALYVKKVAVLGNCNEDDVFQSAVQGEEIINVSESCVQDIHKTGSTNVVQEYEQMIKQFGQGSKALHQSASVCEDDSLQNSSEKLFPFFPNDGATKRQENSFEMSFQKKMENWNKENEKEIVELNEFEFLEQAAEELSFSSNSSLVLKMVHHDWQHSKDRRLSSTPIKSVQHNQMFESSSGPINTRNMHKGNVDLKANCVELEEKFESVFNPLASSEAVVQNVASDSQDQCSICDSTSNSELDSTVTNENKTQKQSVICNSDREDDPKFMCGKQPADNLNKDKNMDTDLDLSSDDDDEYGIKMLTVIENDKYHLSQKADSPFFNIESKSNSSLHQEKVAFDDEQTWIDQEVGFVKEENSSMKPVHTSVLTTPSFYSNKVMEDKVMRRKIASAKKGEAESEKKLKKFEESPPTSDLMARLFPSLKPKAKPRSLQGLEQKSEAMNDKELGSSIQSKIMKDKLLELESEINQFRAENSALAKLRDEKEKAMLDFRKEIADFERKKAEELTQLEECKKEELKRLQKERMVFEKYTAAARAIPDKKEREEIKVLKQQIADLQEEMKRKELRWSSTYTRLRNQIDALTKDNKELRNEVKTMERLRLETWQKANTAIEKKTESSVPQIMKEVTSPRNVKLNHPVKNSASTMIRNTVKESSVSFIRNMESTNETAVCAINRSVPCENFLNQEEVTAPCLEFNGTMDEIQEEIKYLDGKVEQVLRSGRHIIIFCNGTRKEVSADGKTIKVTFFNGDVKQIMSDQTIMPGRHIQLILMVLRCCNSQIIRWRNITQMVERKLPFQTRLLNTCLQMVMKRMCFLMEQLSVCSLMVTRLSNLIMDKGKYTHQASKVGSILMELLKLFI
ncbi:centromere protein J isoform X2 [Narcine bancroftii]|uniref:centromere protein J isoform X2 n=1 Tax=Narcine bancroftii TaxID=1343680 RepID=UPI003831D202